MTDRLKKIERLLALQQQLHRLAEWKLAALDRKKAELASEQESLFGALNDDEPLQGLFVEAMARRLNALARETDKVNRARECASRRLAQEGLTLKRAERMTERVRRQYLEALGKRGFARASRSAGQARRCKPPVSYAGQAWRDEPTPTTSRRSEPMAISPPTDIVLDVSAPRTRARCARRPRVSTDGGGHADLRRNSNAALADASSAALPPAAERQAGCRRECVPRVRGDGARHADRGSHAQR